MADSATAKPPTGSDSSTASQPRSMYAIVEETIYTYDSSRPYRIRHRILSLHPNLTSANTHALHHFLSNIQPHAHDWTLATPDGRLMLSGEWERSGGEGEDGTAVAVAMTVEVEQHVVGDERPAMSSEEYRQHVQRLQLGPRMSRDDMY